MRLSLAGAAACALMLLGASGAAAETRFVSVEGTDTGACAETGAQCATVQYATEQAEDGDTIRIAAGIYAETVSTDKVLTFVGDGAGTPEDSTGATFVFGDEPTDAPARPAFVLPNGGSLRSLRAEGGEGVDGVGFPPVGGQPGGDGIVVVSSDPNTSLELDDVLVIGGPGGGSFPVPAPAGNGVTVSSGTGAAALTATDSRFKGGGGFPTGGTAVSVTGSLTTALLSGSVIGGEVSPFSQSGTLSVADEATATMEGTTVEGFFGPQVGSGSLVMRNSQVLAGIAALVLRPEGSADAEADVTDSVLASGQDGAFLENGAGTGGASLNARGSTFVGMSGSGISVRGNGTSGPVAASLHNSIARVMPEGEPDSADLRAQDAAVVADHSSFTTVLAAEGGSLPPPGSGSNVAGDPQFVDLAPESPNFSLRPSSPLIDRGDPATVAPGETDIVGAPRSLDGNGDCVAAPDIGAYELTGHEAPCTTPPAPAQTPAVDVAPAVSAFELTNRVFAPKGGAKGRRGRAGASARRGRRAVRRGTKFTYRLSEPARVTITIERKRRRKSKRRFVKVGTLNARKQAGRQSTKFSGRLRGKALKPGRYRARIVATDAAGQKSQSRQVSFRVVAR